MERHALITYYTIKNASVTGFINTLGTCNTIPIVNADAVHCFESKLISIILSIHNSLYFKGKKLNLLPPFMVRLAGIEIDEFPKLLALNPTTLVLKW